MIVKVGHPEGDDELERVLVAATMRAAGFATVLREPAQGFNTQLVGATGSLDPAALDRAARTVEGRAATGGRLCALPANRRRPRHARST